MSFIHVPQLLLALDAATLIARRVRVLMYQAPLDLPPFLGAVGEAVEAGHVSLARAIALACGGAWPARLVAAATRQDDPPPREEIEQLRFELDQASVDGLHAIHTLGRIASPLGFIVVIVELGGAMNPDGLAALQHGAPVSHALQGALTAFAIGLATSVVCLAAVASLQRRARELRTDLAKTMRPLLPVLEAGQ